MKRAIAFLMVLALVAALSGCGAKDDTQTAASPAPDQVNGVFTPLDPADDDLDDSLTSQTDFSSSASPDPQSPSDGLDMETGEDDVSLEDTPDVAEPLDDGDDPLEEEPAAAATPAPVSTPAPVVGLAIKDYEYQTYTSTDLSLSLEYPSHWIVDDQTSTSTITFTEPVNSGVPMRLALTVKGYEDKLTNAQAKKEFTDYFTNIKTEGGYEKFKKGTVDTNMSFMNRRGWGCQYKAQLNGGIIRGYVVMTNVEQSKQVVVLHFSAPKNKYNKNSRSMFQKVLFSVKRLVNNT